MNGYSTLLLILSVLCLCGDVTRGDINWNLDIEQDILDYVEHAMECRRVPGLSLAIATTDQVLLQQGFGSADVVEGISADENTRFCIASVTKAFTSTAMGIVLAENAETYPDGWDTRLQDIYGPTFTLGIDDAFRSQRFTIRDLLAHKSGLRSYYGSWYPGLNPNYPRSDYIYRYKFLEPTYDFRTNYLYNDWMYMLASNVIETLEGTGASFEDIVRQKIFGPLNMTRSIFPDDITNWNEIAVAYFLNVSSDVVQPLDPRLLNTTFPSEATGGICSTAVDMAKWLQFQLAEEKVHVLPTDYWTETHTGQFFSGPNGFYIPRYPVAKDTSVYGMGWGTGTYRGYRISAHGGQWVGFESYLIVFHDLDLAIFSGSNGPMYEAMINSVIPYYAADVILGFEPWLNLTTACTYPDPWGQSVFEEPQQHKQTWQAYEPPVQTGESKVMMRAVQDKYVGTYGSLLFGNFTVYFDDPSQTLRFSVGHMGEGELVPDEFWEFFSIWYEGVLSYYHWEGGLSIINGRVFFQDLQYNVTETIPEQFQELSHYGFEPGAPPVFRRGVQWDDL